MSLVRKNAFNNGGTFKNLDLYWYARAVGEMKLRPISDATSWWFYAAIHNEYVTAKNMQANPNKYLNWPNIPSLPKDKLTPLPDTLIHMYWNQCTHHEPLFLPWHRGYLVSFEDKLRSIIKTLGGPEDWALPYWDPCDVKGGTNQLPPAFKEAKLDGTENPLFVPERYGTDFSGLNEKCQGEFSSFDTYSSLIGNQPHDAVHVDTGGFNKRIQQLGLMSRVPSAALDPIFYIHHCNIDRLWAAWNQNGGKNRTDGSWIHADGAKVPFNMPMDTAGTPWSYNPGDVTTTAVTYYNKDTYVYGYDSLSFDQVVSGADNAIAQRLARLNSNFDLTSTIEIPMESNPDLVGASTGLISFSNDSAETQVNFESSAWAEVTESFFQSSPTDIPDKVYLHLEGVKGTEGGNSIVVFVNEERVERVSLFALESEGPHSESGLTYIIDITGFVDGLHVGKNFNVQDLNIRLETKFPMRENGQLTIDRIGIYRLDQ